MAPKSGITLKTRKDSNGLQLTAIVLLLLSAVAGLYFVRIRPASNGQPIDFEVNLERGILAYPGHLRAPLGIRQKYTGIEAVDVVARTLVSAFIAGPAKLEERVWLQQLHVLLAWAPVLGIQVVEASRNCWRSSLAVKYTWYWGVLYQALAGAATLPLFLAFFVWSSHSSRLTVDATRSYLLADQALELASASATLPTIVLGYLIPTLLVWLWTFDDINTQMGLLAFWQITPMLFDVLMVVFKEIASGPDTQNRKTRRPDAELLYPLYALLAGVSGLAHLYAVYLVLTANDPWSYFSTTFLPDSTDAMASTVAGFHNIFQWDAVVMAAVQVGFALYAVYEVKHAAMLPVSAVRATFVVLALAALTGPGAVLALVWWWREVKVVELADADAKTD